MLKYIITGTGRCGTKFASKAFTSAGIPCGHEQVFRFRRMRRPARHLVAESSWAALAYLDSRWAREAILVHLVRHPLKVIGSWLGSDGLIHADVSERPGLRRWNVFAARLLPDLYEFDNLQEMGAYRWVRWNSLLEEHTARRESRFCRVEDGLAATIASLGERGVPTYGDTRCNTLPHPELLLADIPSGRWRDEMVAMGERYGYEF